MALNMNIYKFAKNLKSCKNMKFGILAKKSLENLEFKEILIKKPRKT